MLGSGYKMHSLHSPLPADLLLDLSTEVQSHLPSDSIPRRSAKSSRVWELAREGDGDRMTSATKLKTLLPFGEFQPAPQVDGTRSGWCEQRISF